MKQLTVYPSSLQPEFFQLPITFPELKKKFHGEDKLFFVGSCFAENISKKFSDAGFQVFCNPTGITYNPKSIANTLEFCLEPKQIESNELFSHNGLWHHFDFHSRYSNINNSDAQSRMNLSLTNGANFLQSCNYLFITLGSSYAFEHTGNKNIVSNCHKLPASNFSKKLLSVTEITNSLKIILQKFKEINSSATIILTVSPVRYTRDGITNNHISKGRLLEACIELAKSFEDVIYFPVYEFVIDSLREYRYFAEDMVHPSELCVQTIWLLLKIHYIEPQWQKVIAEIESIRKALNHKAFNPELQQISAHFARAEKSKLELEKKYPWIKI